MGDGGMISGGERKLTFACFPFALVQLLLPCCMNGRTKGIYTHVSTYITYGALLRNTVKAAILRTLLPASKCCSGCYVFAPLH